MAETAWPGGFVPYPPGRVVLRPRRSVIGRVAIGFGALLVAALLALVVAVVTGLLSSPREQPRFLETPGDTALHESAGAHYLLGGGVDGAASVGLAAITVSEDGRPLVLVPDGSGAQDRSYGEDGGQLFTIGRVVVPHSGTVVVHVDTSVQGGGLALLPAEHLDEADAAGGVALLAAIAALVGLVGVLATGAIAAGSSVVAVGRSWEQRSPRRPSTPGASAPTASPWLPRLPPPPG